MVVVAESSSSTRGCDCLAHRFGNAVDRPQRRPRYGSDMSDAEWAVVRDLLPVPGWLSGRGGRPEGYCHRQMIDAVRYLVDNGIKWRAMPADFPPWPRVYAFFARWRDTGLVTELHDRLREAVRASEGPQRRAERGGRGLAVGEGRRHRHLRLTGLRRGQEDQRSQAAPAHRHARTSPGRAGHTGVRDRSGRRPVPSASGGRPLPAAGTGLGRRRLHRPPHRLDQQHLGIVLDIVRRSEDVRGFQVLPRRSVVERSFAWFLRSRRLVRDYERRPDTSEAVIRWSMIALMSRRLAARSRRPAVLTAG